MQELGRDPIAPSLQSLPVNIRVITIEIDPFDDEEMSVLAGLLESTPLLETMEVRIPQFVIENKETYKQVSVEIQDLKRASLQAKINVHISCGSF